MKLPELNAERLAPTRSALHAYAKVLGGWLKAARSKRKHWWHASLRPSLNGLTTGVVRGPVPFELELDLAHSVLNGRTSLGASLTEGLRGQSAAALGARIASFLADAGVETEQPSIDDTQEFDFDSTVAAEMGRAFAFVAGAMADFRTGTREESSPIQIWPHHFDLSLIWLPGEKIAGQDPNDEEHSDKQMNFGFTFGDDAIKDPYFYVTAYPAPDAMASVSIPAGAIWRSDSFTGAVMDYGYLLGTEDPHAHLLKLWHTLRDAGRTLMLNSRGQ
jgi:hypothetical protein